MGFLAVLISILLAAAWSALDFEPREIPYPNGPRSVPILGSLWFMSRLWRNANGELLNLARKYGGMCMLWFGSRPILVISKTKDALELMEKVCESQVGTPFLSKVHSHLVERVHILLEASPDRFQGYGMAVETYRHPGWRKIHLASETIPEAFGTPTVGSISEISRLRV